MSGDRDARASKVVSPPITRPPHYSAAPTRTANCVNTESAASSYPRIRSPIAHRPPILPRPSSATPPMPPIPRIMPSPHTSLAPRILSHAPPGPGSILSTAADHYYTHSSRKTLSFLSAAAVATDLMTTAVVVMLLLYI